jgi:hypothetical protein
MNARKDIRDRMDFERRTAKSNYYILPFIFVFFIFMGFLILYFSIIENEIIAGIYISGIMFYGAFFLALSELIRSRKIIKGEVGVRGEDWSTESVISKSLVYFVLGLSGLFGFSLILYILIGNDYDYGFICLLFALIIFGWFAYMLFSMNFGLWDYKYKIFKHSDDIKPKIILEGIMKREGLIFEYCTPPEKSIHSEFDLVMKTAQGFYVRLDNIEDENLYWISIGPKDEENEEIVGKVMEEVDREFGIQA